MYEGGLLYNLYNIGYRMLDFFIWFFEWMNTPHPLIGSITPIQFAFGSGLALYFLTSLIEVLSGGLYPGD